MPGKVHFHGFRPSYGLSTTTGAGCTIQNFLAVHCEHAWVRLREFLLFEHLRTLPVNINLANSLPYHAEKSGSGLLGVLVREFLQPRKAMEAYLASIFQLLSTVDEVLPPWGVDPQTNKINDSHKLPVIRCVQHENRFARLQLIRKLLDCVRPPLTKLFDVNAMLPEHLCDHRNRSVLEVRTGSNPYLSSLVHLQDVTSFLLRPPFVSEDGILCLLI
mmetsp:Transcript_107034/g.205874  ORF Transcript_107034/g.205874 Transcript_107034/m.205874 type:complete len:217 (-) Transcript_107034:128-778(-)